MPRVLARIASLAIVVAAAACAEDLEGEAGCPVLCPGQDLRMRDTTLEASIVIDTTLPGYPPRGSGIYLLASNSGDSLDSRFVVRFDSLGRRYVRGADTLDVTEVDSVRFRFFIDSTLSKATAPVTFEVYDVDTTAADADTEALLPLFRPDRLLGTATVEVANLKDTIPVDVYLSNAAVLAKILADERLRLGVRVESPEPVRVAVINANDRTRFQTLRYDAAPAQIDSQVGLIGLPPRSRTPADDPSLAIDFTDYLIVTPGTPGPPPGTVAVGGARGQRIYYRFDLPASLTDSASIVRASLLLTQRPAPTFGFSDTVLVIPHVVLASEEVTDLAKAALIIDTTAAGGTLFALPAIRVAPQDSAERRIELVNVARFWRSASKERVPQAIVLRSFAEGRQAVELRFFSLEAAEASVRPRIRIVYVPRSEFGIP